MRLFRLIVRAWDRRAAPVIARASTLEAQCILHFARRLDAPTMGARKAPASVHARVLAAERAIDRAIDFAERHIRRAPAQLRAWLRHGRAGHGPRRPLQARQRVIGVLRAGARRVRPITRWVAQPKTSQPVVLSVAGLAAAGIVLAAFAPVERIAVATGLVIDEGASLVISHPEGGAIVQMAVASGQLVSAGDVLFRLEPRAAAGDMQAVRLRAARLAMTKARLNALMDSTDAPAFSSDADLDPARAHAEQVRFEAERARLERSLRTLDEAARQARADLDRLQREKADIGAQLSQLGQSNRPTQSLAGDVGVLRMQWRFAALNREFESVRRALSQAEAQRAERLADQRREWAAELSRVSAELETLDAALLRFADRASDFEVRAPAGGRVLWATQRSIGDVVSANEVLVQILPSDAELVAEVWSTAFETRHVRVGDSVRMRLDSAPNGQPVMPVRSHDHIINGIVKWIDASPAGAVERNGRRRVLVSLTQVGEGDRPLDIEVAPGAGVHAEIVVSQMSGAPRIAGWLSAHASTAP